jgi:hypothetical protein
MRKSFQINSQDMVARLHAIGGSEEDVRANAGIGMLDFWQEVDTRLTKIRQNQKFAIVNDIASLATSMKIGSLSGVNLMSGDISDDVTRSMDFQGKVSFDSINSNYDKNPVPVFMAGQGLNYRTYMGQQDSQLGLFMEAMERKTIKLAENVGDYMYNGDAKVVADGQAGEGVKNHRNTSKINLGAAGFNIDLVAATNDELVTFFVQDIGEIIDDNALTSLDIMWVSPEIYRRLLQPVGGTGQFKDGSMREYLVRNSEIGAIEKDYSLTGNEFITYKRDQQVISPLIALPMTSFQLPRNDPYANFNQKMVTVQGLKVAKTMDDKYGVFYASNVS